ncbi:putative xenobiotic-transporting ATPase [Rosa chinensis]|uniref:Putative xenobiotic-transporting ATPase n=1 Tax=Rosa chinensis TaxID=74649 RepID=A0A2P6Q600_ROSCH|nr:putative xenobiotic-transporting ATPase [Rosa chinensis]
MGFKPIDWYRQPVANGVWAKAASAFGSYTPCAMDSMVICISHLVLFSLCCYRIWMIKKNLKAWRFRLRSNYYNCLLGLLAGYSTAEPILRLVIGLSLFNKYGFAPFEITSLIIEALAWCSMIILIGLETKIYIREFRWYVRFLQRVLFGVLLLFYVPILDPYPGYVVLQSESLDNAEYEALPGEVETCPERHVNIFSSESYELNANAFVLLFSFVWYRKPITETDVWKLDTWDQTERLIKRSNFASFSVVNSLFYSHLHHRRNHFSIFRFQECWVEESQRSKPWLLRALNCSLGRRFWLAGFFKSMQRDDPAWIGYIYAFLIFIGVSFGVLPEAHYYQNIFRAGFRLRSTLVNFCINKKI